MSDTGVSIEEAIAIAAKALQQGELQHAEDICSKILTLIPDYADANHLLGHVYISRNKPARALFYLHAANNSDSSNAELKNTIGVVYYKLGSFKKAIEWQLAAVKLAPESVAVLNNLSNSYISNKEYDKAIEVAEQAIAINPEFKEAINGIGLALLEKASYRQAIGYFEKAYSLDNTYLQPLYNKANACYRLGEYGPAREYYKKYIGAHAVNGNDALLIAANNNLVATLIELQEFKEALRICDEQLSIEPGSLEIHRNRHKVLVSLLRFNEAAETRKIIQSLDNDIADLSCDYMMALYEYAVDNELLKKMALRYEHASRVEHRLHAKNEQQHKLARIGIMSGDMRMHSVGYFLRALLEGISNTKYELHAFVYQRKNDEFTEILRQCFDEWHDIQLLDDVEAAQFIYEREIDVLIDLSGHTEPNRLGVLAHKPCARQIEWLGFPATTGLASMDYIIGDSFTLPEGDEHLYVEQILRLPETSICYTPHIQAEKIAVAGLPCLKSEEFCFGSFNNMTKINQRVVALWSEILHAIPHACLILKEKRLSSRAAHETVYDWFASHGIERARLELVDFLPYDEHFTLYNRIDLALDPFPYNGTTTTCEALYMGVPTVTLAGTGYMISHYGELINHLVGLDELVAATEQEYRDIAIACAQNPGRLADIRSKARQRMLASPLCDVSRFAAHFSTLLDTVLKRNS